MKGAYMEYLFVHDRQGGWWLKIDRLSPKNQQQI